MIPEQLRRVAQWLVSDADKIPHNPKTGRRVSIHDRSQYASYEEAFSFIQTYPGWNLGFVLTRDDPYTVIDLDDTDNPEELARQIQIYNAFPTYAERSRSGKGVHIWCLGSVPSGARRDEVEVYPFDRYMICTGDPVNGHLEIVDCQYMLTALYAEMHPKGSNGDIPDLIDVEEKYDDDYIFDMAMNAVDGDKFDRLWRGDWKSFGIYESASEGDYALLNILAFYTQNNDQVIRMFGKSALGQVIKDGKVKSSCIGKLKREIAKIRSELPPPIEFSKLIKFEMSHPAMLALTPVKIPRTGEGKGTGEEKNLAVKLAGGAEFTLPPGFVGEIAQYILDTSIRPVPEVATAAAIGLCAGTVGRRFNISGMGLNLYIMLLCETVIGKEGGSSGIERLLAACNGLCQVDLAEVIIGPDSFASGGGMVSALTDNPCFVAVVGEIGLDLQKYSDTNVTGQHAVYQRNLLALFSKTGKGRTWNFTAYSDKKKNKVKIVSPALTILGDSVPSVFFAGLDESHLLCGLIPRFLTIEYYGKRPPPNDLNMLKPPTDKMAQRFIDLAQVVADMNRTNAWNIVELSPQAEKLLLEYRAQCDKDIDAHAGRAGLRELLSRGHEKALRLYGVLAASDRPHTYVVTGEEAKWAVDLVRRDIANIAKRFDQGDIGRGESVKISKMKQFFQEYLVTEYKENYDFQKKWQSDRVIALSFIQSKAYGWPVFKFEKDPSKPIKAVLDHLVESGVLAEVPKQQVQERYGRRKTMYFIATTL